jgi:glycosyltransferase 2 family protein
MNQSANRTRAWALRITGTLIFVALLVILNIRGDLKLDDVWNAITGANPVLVALSLLFYVPFLVVKAARWRIVSADMKMPMTWAEAWRIYAIGLAAGTFTPGQAGDALKAWFLQRLGNPLGRALGSSVLDRVFDVAALAALGLLGVLIYGNRFAGQTPALVAWVVVCVAGVAFFIYQPTRTWAFGLVSRRLSKFGGQAVGDPAQSSSWSLQPTTLVFAGLLTLASFGVSIFRVWLLAAALGIWLNPLEVSGYVGLTTAAALVPVTVGGVGTRDAISVLALSQLGFAASQGLALSALILLLNLAQAVTGWLVWLRYKPNSPALPAEGPVPAEQARGRM